MQQASVISAAVSGFEPFMMQMYRSVASRIITPRVQAEIVSSRILCRLNRSSSTSCTGWPLSFSVK
ncbi:hypothetical protein D3C81_2300320 [compost metagenome]